MTPVQPPARGGKENQRGQVLGYVDDNCKPVAPVVGIGVLPVWRRVSNEDLEMCAVGENKHDELASTATSTRRMAAAHGGIRLTRGRHS